MESSLAVLAQDATDETVAMLMAQAARLHYFRGELDIASSWVDRALEAGEELALPEVLSQALNTKSLIIRTRGHEEEAQALLKHALDIAIENDLPNATGRALNNLADTFLVQDRVEEALLHDSRNFELSARRGDRPGQMTAMIHLVIDYVALGRWDEAMSLLTGLPLQPEDLWITIIQSAAIPVLVSRGELEAASARLANLYALGESTEVQDQFFRNVMTAQVRQGEGLFEKALAAAETALNLRDRLGRLPGVRVAFDLALEASFDLGRLDHVDELLSVAESAPPRDRTPSIRASEARFRGRLAAARGNAAEADHQMSEAIGLLRDVGYRFWMAIVEIEQAEMLLAAGQTEQAEPLLAEARDVFEQLGAKPWLERVARSESAPLVRTAVS